METQIDRDAARILAALAKAQRDELISAADLASRTGVSPERINDAVALLVDSGYAEWIKVMGTAPFDFSDVIISSRGRYEHQRLEAENEKAAAPVQAIRESTGTSVLARPPAPVGSPYGFTDEDWEVVAEQKTSPDQLFCVLGHQFESEHFSANDLRINIGSMLQRAVDLYNAQHRGFALILGYKPLTAGYGEHLFNEIARDIIGADVAVFDTSDLNPNVMLEMGVALTWGVRVLPIKAEGRPKPPSDVSGQTWADYRNSGALFVDPDHDRKMVRLIERAIRKKGRSPV
jgi:hypothetical protein